MVMTCEVNPKCQSRESECGWIPQDELQREVRAPAGDTGALSPRPELIRVRGTHQPQGRARTHRREGTRGGGRDSHSVHTQDTHPPRAWGSV